MALRMIELIAPSATPDEHLEFSDECTTLGLWREELTNDLTLFRILVQAEHSEPVLNKLETHFAHDDTFRVFIFEVAATLPQPQEETPADHSEPTAETEKIEKTEKKDPKRVAVAELVQKLSTGATVDRTYLVTVTLSTIVAAVGLIRDNVAVIIGAMVIAPLLAPNITLSLATTLGDLKLARRSLIVNITGVSLALTLSTLAGLFLSFDIDNHEISSRTTVALSDIALALAAGSAGALAFTTGISAALVGVMVAVALLPPLVTSGLLVGAREWTLAERALLLTATNIVCINAAGVATFLLQGVRPSRWWEAKRAKRTVRIAAIVWVTLLALLAFLIYLASPSSETA